MADITSIQPSGSTTNLPLDRPAPARTVVSASEGTDCVEISDLARLLSSLDPDRQAVLRAQKVADIRAAVADGTYETDDKIDYVVSRLMDVLRDTPREVYAD